MAIICTNFLTGNDTTGDGTVATPYKSILKALAGATSGDEIRAAGGQWTAITGTLTFNQNSLTVNTTTDLRAQISVNDILTFNDSDFGFDKFTIRVNAITATTITTGSAWCGSTITTSGVYKLNAYHYNTTTFGNIFEPFNSMDYMPNGRTDIVVSGGWDATYTSNANGWTAVRGTQACYLFGSNTAPGLGDWRNDLLIDKFLFCGLGGSSLIGLWVGSTGYAPSIGVKELSFGDSSTNNVIITGTGAGTLGSGPGKTLSIFSPKGASGAKFYLTNTNTLIPSNVVNSPYYSNYLNPFSTGLTGYTPTDFVVDELWVTGNAAANPSVTNRQFPFTIPYSANKGSTFYKIKDYKFRSLPTSNTLGRVCNQNMFLMTGQVENLQIYSYRSSVYQPYTSTITFSNLQIGGIYITGPAASTSGIIYSPAATNGNQDIIDYTSYTIESTNPIYNATAGATAGVEENNRIAKLGQLSLSSVQIKDVEGFKTLDSSGNVYYKDPINGLRITGTKFSSSTGVTGGFTAWKVVGVLERPTTAFTVSFSLRAESGTWDQIAVQYGPLNSQTVYQDITATSSFATYSITIDPTVIPDWNSFIFALYIGIRSNMPNLFYEEPAPVAYIQSLTIL